ncbi:thiamine-phosphate kinase [Prosthecodimorpha staleyi]|uniref:Thiamine-monophosphate kinase n=1 Tax=Prosthecodimorpha staleyi TaxID=2840188 RepID=A0A947GCR1_9HYPH|nr:thiamine-phosphate kinase [Prosthecodimorpha staleyi]MBT9290027.1 thiamine-phosphate kinase [Prosthecodimorpha staleyi]
MAEPVRPSEDALIARWFRPLATDPASFRLGDDCASLTPPPGADLVLKTDAVAAGIHFFADDPWDAVAAKALRVNLSDLAAKGARPLGYLLSLALPADWRVDQMEAFAAGLGADQARFGVALWGGDTIRSPDGLVISITAIGAVPQGRMVRRGGARPGDRLYVSGTLGDAALGLMLRLDPDRASAWGLTPAARDHLLARYLLPEPRVALAPAILAHARGAMDLSDGLVIDAGRMARSSGVSIRIGAAAVPLSPAAAHALEAEPGLLRAILAGGDDYELLVAVPAAAASDFERAAADCGIGVTAIGTVGAAPVDADAPIVTITGSDDRAIAIGAEGFRHF